MKTLTTLAAAAALIAGMSIAAAQNTNMNAPKTGDQATTAGTGEYCIKGANGAQNCSFADLASCQKAAAGKGSCEPNTKSSATTGTKQ
jgi:hypothetical protein